MLQLKNLNPTPPFQQKEVGFWWGFLEAEVELNCARAALDICWCSVPAIAFPVPIPGCDAAATICAVTR